MIASERLELELASAPGIPYWPNWPGAPYWPGCPYGPG